MTGSEVGARERGERDQESRDSNLGRAANEAIGTDIKITFNSVVEF